METRPKEKSLRMLPFVTHATRGVIRDQSTRRKTMCVLLAVAVFMLIAGSTFLQERLDHNEHAWVFIVFWLACGWLTATALLLALFDLLIVRTQGRAARRGLRAKFSPSSSDRPDR